MEALLLRLLLYLPPLVTRLSVRSSYMERAIEGMEYVALTTLQIWLTPWDQLEPTQISLATLLVPPPLEEIVQIQEASSRAL